MKGAVELDVSDADTRRMLANIDVPTPLQLRGPASSAPETILNESAQKMYEEAEAQAAIRLKADRDNELAAAQRAREARKEEAEAKKSPEDRKRAELAKLCNNVAAKVRQLQAAEVYIRELRTDSEEATRIAELSKSQHANLLKIYEQLKKEIDTLIALGRRATITVLEGKLSQYTTTFCC